MKSPHAFPVWNHRIKILGKSFCLALAVSYVAWVIQTASIPVFEVRWRFKIVNCEYCTDDVSEREKLQIVQQCVVVPGMGSQIVEEGDAFRFPRSWSELKAKLATIFSPPRPNPYGKIFWVKVRGYSAMNVASATYDGLARARIIVNARHAEAKVRFERRLLQVQNQIISAASSEPDRVLYQNFWRECRWDAFSNIADDLHSVDVVYWTPWPHDWAMILGCTVVLWGFVVAILSRRRVGLLHRSSSTSCALTLN